MARFWEVVGGEGKGGILVREGRQLSSAESAGGRLAKGALVEELELVGERLRYKLREGLGPASGWISLSLSGKPLVQQTAVIASSGTLTGDTPVFDVPLALGGCTKVSCFEGNFESEAFVPELRPSAKPEWDGLLPPKPRGIFVPEPTGRPQLSVWTPTKARLLHGRQSETFPWKDKLFALPSDTFISNLKQLETSLPDGWFYSIPFPYSLKTLEKAGPSFLTKAFHAAGTLPRDNSITQAQYKEFVGGGACLKAIIDVKYAKQDATLHDKLFVKYPFNIASEAELRIAYSFCCMTNNDGPEIDFARMLSSAAPMRCPKYYFGDICEKTGKSLLITECFAFPDEDVDFGPMELEPIPHKAVDYLLDKPFDYYAAIVRNFATIAAWGKCGKLGDNFKATWPAAAQPDMPAMGVKRKIQGFLTFFKDVAPQLLPKGFIDSDFEQSLNVLIDIEKSQMEIFHFLFKSNPDMLGFTHQNMNIDNAFFWRDPGGNIESGFIDWGRAKNDNYGLALLHGFTCCDLVEFLLASEKELLSVFVSAHKAAGGPTINIETMWEHYLLAWCMNSLFLVSIPGPLIYDSWQYTSVDGWKTVENYHDPRIYHMPNCNCGWVAMARQFAWHWKYKGIPEFFAKWREAHPPGSAKAKK